MFGIDAPTDLDQAFSLHDQETVADGAAFAFSFGGEVANLTALIALAIETPHDEVPHFRFCLQLDGDVALIARGRHILGEGFPILRFDFPHNQLGCFNGWE
jgi:hypothetical protein